MHHLSVRRRLAALAALLVAGLTTSPGGAAAQQQMSPEQLQQLLEEARARQGVEEPAAGASEIVEERWSAPTAGPLLDRMISRTEYQLGPGDRITLAIFGYRNQVYALTVTPEGTVVVPSIGVIPMGGLTLDEATRRARRQVLRFHPDADVEVSLASVRSFNVFVVGDVVNPGIRPATAVTRLSQVVPAADPDGVFYRNITIRRGVDTLQVNLSRFLQTGDTSFNPFLREGDVVQVPIVDETVTVTGEVAYPGTYQYLPDETLAEFIRMANGGPSFLSKAADTLVLMRFGNDPRGEIHQIPQAEVDHASASLTVEPFDAVYVPRLSHYKEQTSVNVLGEVVRPGRYPIRPDVTTIRDVIAMAGGFTTEAAVSEVLLRRDRDELPSTASEPLAAIPPEFLTSEERRILQVTSRADESNVVIDVSRSAATHELTVENQDVLFIPKVREGITVLGAVAQPGLVAYTPNQSLDFFVSMAGGYVRRADVGDAVVLRTRAGTQLDREDITWIEPGDRIVVPFRERTSFLEAVQTTQGVVSTISGVILTIVGIERLWEAVTN